MNNLISIYEVLVFGTVLLSTGIIVLREPGQDWRSACNESLAWGAGFFFTYGAAVLMFELVPRVHI